MGIRVAQDVHHHRWISGWSVRRRTKGMTCAIERQGPGESGFTAHVPELFCNRGQVPAFRSPWGKQPAFSDRRPISLTDIHPRTERA